VGAPFEKLATPTHPFFLQSIAKKVCFLVSDYECKCRKHISYLQEKNARKKRSFLFFLIISKLHGQTRGHAPLLITIGINFPRLRQCGVQCATNGGAGVVFKNNLKYYLFCCHKTLVHQIKIQRIDILIIRYLVWHVYAANG